MSDKRWKDQCWQINESLPMSLQGAQLAVLMDIRDELKRLNGLLGCQNFLNIPRELRQIRLNTTKRKAKR